MTDTLDRPAQHVARSGERSFAITLIHGTGAKGADWTQPEKSKLCAALRAEFGGAVQFERFDWEPPNKHEARYHASKQLLEKHGKDAPGGGVDAMPRFLIGHSHGGTVMAYALRDDPEFAKSLCGVAFLSTPFIQVRERLDTRWLLMVAPSVAAVTVFMIFAAIGTLGVALARDALPKSDYGTAIVLAVMLAAAAISYGAFRVARALLSPREGRLPGFLDSAVQKSLAQMDLRRLAEIGLNRRTLIVRTNADEASSALAMAHMLSRVIGEIPARLARAPTKWGNHLTMRMDQLGDNLAKKFERSAFETRRSRLSRWFIGTAIVAFFAIAAVRLWMGAAAVEAAWPIYAAVEKVISDTLSSTYVFYVWFLIAIAFLSVVLAFGRWAGLAALFLEYSVETTPPGEWRVNQLDLRESVWRADVHNAFGLSHSMSYDDPRSHRIIASWIRDRLAAT
jgi:hypothetical protein